MLIKTKKYQLDKKLYVKLAMGSAIKSTWWFLLIPLAIMGASWFLPGTGWWIALGITLILGYFLFWWIQFTGLTQLEQGKMMFDKYSYQITSQQILMMLNSKQGMPIKWEQIKSARVGKDYFILSISKAQIIHFPFKIFNNDNEVKFVKSILEKKGLV